MTKISSPFKLAAQITRLQMLLLAQSAAQAARRGRLHLTLLLLVQHQSTSTIAHLVTSSEFRSHLLNLNRSRIALGAVRSASA